MINNPKKILKKYWGFDNFRALQEEIISEALNKRDVLALLPTGGGKSICFQVPSLCQEGICIVVSPLIALMKDQVSNLKRKGIKAQAIFSGMSKREIDIALDNCVYGNFKFLYVSPERLKSDLFQARLKKMTVNLVAIDEAHCISQWGYDFRPSYMAIAELREQLPDVPFMALTATATDRVVIDIQEKLEFKKQNALKKSFYRENLRYFVEHTSDKYTKMMAIIQKQKGSGIVYVRSRRKTVEFAHYLKVRGVSATYYHAGLSNEEREKRQLQWQNDTCKVIVSTNAFGMGIDKPNVRFVINMDLPECIEAYFQEAGRAGRDELKAYSVLLVNEADRLDLLNRLENKFPPVDTIKRVYTLLCNKLRLAIGVGEGETFSVDLDALKENSPFSFFEIMNSLGFLERAGYIIQSDGFRQPSRVKIDMKSNDLYAFQVRYPLFDKVLKVILRSYTSVFETFVAIDEEKISKRLKLKKWDIIKALQEMDKQEVLSYQQQSNAAAITFLQPRVDAKYLRIDDKVYHSIKEVQVNNVKAMLDYTFQKEVCRVQILLNYFGEKNAPECGTCDVCLSKKNNSNLKDKERKEIENDIIKHLKTGISFVELKDLTIILKEKYQPEKIKNTIHWMLDNDLLVLNDLNQITLK